MTTKSTERRERYQIHGELDGRDAEALRVELVWLARRHGFELEDFIVEPVAARRPTLRKARRT